MGICLSLITSQSKLSLNFEVKQTPQISERIPFLFIAASFASALYKPS